MPFTFNGVGTRYVGKQNLISRVGACGHCGRSAMLESFDTREWFVLAFLPVIPLSRYHILEKCASCTRHQRLLAKLWEDLRAQARLDAQSLVRQRPGDPRTAIDAHRKLSEYQLQEDAAELEHAMAQQFQGDADTLVYLAGVSARAGRGADALRRYELAHLADPAHPVAREGLAYDAVQRGDARRALELLGPLLEARTLQSTGAACALATALFEAGSFAEAQRVHEALLQRFPLLGNDKRFAREVAKCAKALGTKRASLPALARRRLQWTLAACAIAAALAGVLWADFAAAAHVKLYVVDSAPGKLRVEIPGADPLDFRGAGVREVELPAGTYRARVRGAVEREVEFTLATHGWPRFLDGTLHVLDATGESILAVEESTYSRLDTNQRFGRRFLYGRDFHSLRGIDFAFEPFPKTIQVSSPTAAEKRTRVDLVEEPLESVVYGLLAQKDVRAALDLASWSLKHDFGSDATLACYLEAVHASRKEHEAAGFLAPRLNARPVRYAAHEAFLDLLVGPGDRERGLAIYRDLREKEPREAAWPYLMACLSNRIREREPLLRESLAGDAPPNVWHLQAATQASAGAWEAALASADSALEPESSDGRSLYLRFDALGALQRNEDLDQQLRAVLEASPSDCNSALRLLERLPRGTSDAEVVQQLAELQQRARKLSQPVQPESIVFLHAWTAFVLGDLPALEQLDRVTRDQSLRWLHASLLADMGRLPELRLFLEGRQRCQIEPYDALAIALACRAGGEDAQAELWEQRALPGLSAGIDLETARLLGGSRRSVADEALDLALPPWRKAVVLGLLSFSDKAQRVRLLQAAVRLQSRPIFPRRVLEELASKSVPR